MPTERALRKKECIEPQADVTELHFFFGILISCSKR
jgi:hypothetical protein